MYLLVSEIQLWMTDVSQFLQRGSLASSHANTADEDLYLDTTASIYAR